jgi:hypothetical protein
VTGRLATSQAQQSEVVDHGVLDAARVLRETLVRVHPSFRFEERLAGRLASRTRIRAVDDARADAAERDAEAFGGSAVIPFPLPAPMAAIEALPGAFDPDGDLAVFATVAERPAWWEQVPRGALIGGAIASGFSIAGAALLARRWRQRPPRVAQSGRGAA